MIVVVTDHAAANHAPKSVHAAQHGIERLAADVIEVDIDPLGANLHYSLGQVATGFIVDGGVSTELLSDDARLVVAAHDAHDLAPA